MAPADASSPVDLPAAGETFVATLRAAEVVPPVTSAAGGTLELVLDPGQTWIAYRLQHTVVGATGGSMRIGSAGENGTPGIVITSGSGEVHGMVGLTPAQVAALTTGRLYVTVESAAFPGPGGEIRGQILRPGEREFLGHLSGAQQAPPNDSTGTGLATFIVNAARDSVKWRVASSNVILQPADSFASLHKGPFGLISHTVVFFLSPLGDVMTGDEPVDAPGLADLQRGLWFVDIHTPAFPGGEVRGQLAELGETHYLATFTGDDEMPPVITAGLGGIGIILDTAKTRIRYEGGVESMTPTGAQIGVGPAGMPGTVAYTLSVSGTTISGDQVVNPTDVANLENGSWFVNVTSAMYPAGEVRGQLIRR
jgi:hypothetical protein